MLLDDATSALIKDFIIAKLDGHDAEADSDILADYCLALLKSNDVPDAALKASVAENLKDFLPERYESFTDDLFAALAIKSYNPSQLPSNATAATGNSPSWPQGSVAPERTPYERSKKRRYIDLDAVDSQEAGTHAHLRSGAERPAKQMRRGGRSGRGIRGEEQERNGRFAQQSFKTTKNVNDKYEHQTYPLNNFQSASASSFATPFPGFADTALDPANPMAPMEMMQQMLRMMAEMAGMNAGLESQTTKQRCRDYDIKGFCTRGASCPFEHGRDKLVVPPNGEYDSGTALLGAGPYHPGGVGMKATGRGGFSHGRTRDRKETYRGGGSRSTLSHVGPNADHRVASIIIEGIPEDSLREETVRDFFAQFGKIDHIEMQSHKRLAVVTFEDHESAEAAYESPKVVFDNRFVKVYWAKSEPDGLQSRNGNSVHAGSHEVDADMADETQQPDSEELARKREEAQRRYEQQKELREAAEAQKTELDAKLRTIEAERQRFTKILAKRTGQSTTSSAPNTSISKDFTDDEHTRVLKEQLAKLEAEAKSLGIEPDHTSDLANSEYQSYNYPSARFSRGRGGYRGRGRDRGRGTHVGYPGDFAGHHSKPFTGVRKLDNRPKTVMVVFQTRDYDAHEETLRQHLLFGHETASLARHPDLTDAAIVTFQQRYEAENFMVDAQTSATLGRGKTELSWYVANQGPEREDMKADEDRNSKVPPTAVEVREVRDLDTYNDEDEVY